MVQSSSQGKPGRLRCGQLDVDFSYFDTTVELFVKECIFEELEFILEPDLVARITRQQSDGFFRSPACFL
jgi:hypothetical protein